MEGYAGGPGSYLGGLSLTDWINYVGSFAPGSQGRTAAISTMLDELELGYSGAQQNYGSKSWAASVYWSGKFLEGLSNREYKPEDTKQKAALEDITNLIYSDNRYARLANRLREGRDLQEFGDIGNRAIQDYVESITPRSEEEEDFGDIMRSAFPGGRKIGPHEGQQLANRFAQLFLASGYYDKVYDIDNRYAEWQKTHPNDKISRMDFARVLMGHSGTGQWAQYQASMKAKDWFDQNQGLFRFDTSGAGEGMLPGLDALMRLEDDFFGDDPQTRNLMKSLRNVYTNLPNLLLDDKVDPHSFPKEFYKQMTGSKID